MQPRSPRNNWQRNEAARQKLSNIVADPILNDAFTVVMAMLAREASSMPDAAAYLRGARDFQYSLQTLSDVEKEKPKPTLSGLPNPIRDR